MRLIDDWRTVLKKAWSIRISLCSAVLSGTEVAVQYLAPAHPPPVFAMGAAALSIVSTVMRIVAQPTLWKHDDTEDKCPTTPGT